MSQIKAIISDADGTLVNTLYLIRHGQYETAVEYLLQSGIPRSHIPRYDIYESYINKSVGGSTRETFEKTLRLIFAKNREQYLKEIDFEDLDKRLDLVQDRLAPLYVHPFFGLTELLTWCGLNKVKFGIFTSGNRRMIIRNFGVSLPVMGFTNLFLSDELDIGERFQAFMTRITAVYGIPQVAISTCEDVKKTKPDPEGITRLMQALEVNADEVLIMGDHPMDMLAATNANLEPIGISHGFGSPAELKESGAVRVVRDLTSIPKIINAHNNGGESLFTH
jgi:phosphoglycolate phosphatase-like HAD superfamily hydrolase